MNLDLSFLPTVNACLNSLATILLVRGRLLIARGEVDAHRRTMLSAFAVSALFLTFYVLHKAWRSFENTPYNAEGVAKLVYLSILFTHLVLAMTVPVLAITLIVFGLRGHIGRHRRLAKVAWPIWLYVSLTGVVIYWMLYHANPAAA